MRINSKTKILYSFTALLLSTLIACGGSNGSSSDIPENSAENQPPTVTAFSAMASQLSVDFSWAVADTDGDSLSCILSPGGGLSDIAIADCLSTQMMNINYNDAGTYTATLTVSDTSGQTANQVTTFSTTLAINQPPTINTFSTIVNELNVDFSWVVADIEGDALSCTLSPGAGLADIAITDCLVTQAMTVNYTNAGTFEATLTVTDLENEITSDPISFTTEDSRAELTLGAGILFSESVYIKGGFNNWSTDNEMMFENGVYLFEQALSVGAIEFKIANDDWEALDCGTSNPVVDADPVVIVCQAGTSNIQMTIPTSSNYRFGFSYQSDGSAQIQVIDIGTEGDGSGLGTAGTVVVNYLRADPEYQGWGMHLWGNAVDPSVITQWALPRTFDRIENGVAVFEVPIENAEGNFNFIMHLGDFKSPDHDTTIIPADFGLDVWIVQSATNLIPFKTEAEARAALEELGNQSFSLDLSDVTMLDNSTGVTPGWTNSANFMEIYIRGYQDSDGDGIGDLNGLISRLDYLQEIGITALWLMPVMASSDHDHGYATVDYRAIESDYGSMADFEQLLDEAHDRGIAIIIDYVMNHSSSANPLFLDSAFSVDNDKRDWYVWEDEKLTGWQTFAGDPWRNGGNGWYYGVFTSQMPDFNLKNPEVVDYHLNNFKFWLNKGVDGFRFDAVGVLYEFGSGEWEDSAQNHVLMKQSRELIESYQDRYIVCEAPSDFSAYATTDSCGRAFNFAAHGAIIDTARNSRLNGDFVDQVTSDNTDNMPFILSNHDSFAGDRVWNQLQENMSDYRLAAATYLLTSSTPFTYYGEEIGIANGIGLTGDWAIRTPMSWNSDAINAGFSTVTPFRNLAENSVTNNVELEQVDESSLLNYYKSLYLLRKDNPVIGSGILNFQSQANDTLMKLTRSDNTRTIVIAINYSDTVQTTNISTGMNSAEFTEIFSTASTVSSNSSGELSIDVAAKSVRVMLTEL